MEKPVFDALIVFGLFDCQIYPLYLLSQNKSQPMSNHSLRLTSFIIDRIFFTQSQITPNIPQLTGVSDSLRPTLDSDVCREPLEQSRPPAKLHINTVPLQIQWCSKCKHREIFQPHQRHIHSRSQQRPNEVWWFPKVLLPGKITHTCLASSQLQCTLCRNDLVSCHKKGGMDKEGWFDFSS